MSTVAQTESIAYTPPGPVAALFIQDRNPFSGIMGPVGCIAGDTLIMTENGAIPISRIDRPVRVVSWDEKNEKFVLSPSGGAFPKGEDYLYRVTTTRGEFEALGSHRILLPEGNYSRVDELRVGAVIAGASENLLRTNVSILRSTSPEGDPHSTRIAVDFLARYAALARLCGLPLLSAKAAAPASAPLPGGALTHTRILVDLGNQWEVTPSHIHSALYGGLQNTLRFLRRAFCLPVLQQLASANHVSGQFDEPCSGAVQWQAQFLLKIVRRLQEAKLFRRWSLPFSSDEIRPLSILSITQLDFKQIYWDMQVLNTHNYVTTDGTIHHNSGKTSAAVMRLASIAVSQAPYRNRRLTRHLVTRATYPELRSTTIKTFLEWFPEGSVTQMNWGGLISGRLKFQLQDRTVVDAEVIFVSLDRPEDVAKIRGMELTTAWMNEASEGSKAAWDMMTQRVGRFPPKRWGGPTWSGAFFDTNPPDDDHWLYQLFEENRHEGHAFYRQPGALIYRNGVYEDNPAAENVQNHALGYEYWRRMVSGKTREWCKVFLEGNWGTISSGKPVYPEYSDELHCRIIKPYEGAPLLLGFDYGLTPAVSICQVSPRGQFRILADIQSENMGIRQFARDVVKPFLAMNFPNYKIQATGDPSGSRRADSDEKTCFMELAEAGIPAMPAITNEFLARREAVAGYLTKLIDGEPGLLVHPDAKMNRKGMNGGYCFKRMQIVGSERYRDVPDKNIYSHGCEATQYAALHTQTMQLSNDFGKKIVYPQMGIV